MSGSGTRRPDTEIPLEELHKDWLHVYQEFKPGKKGVPLATIRDRLVSRESQHEIPAEIAEALLAHYDKDKDGNLSYMEFLDLVLAKEYQLEKRPIIRRAIWLSAYTVVPRNRRERWGRTYLDEHRCWPPPVFMILISIIELGFFIYQIVQQGTTLAVHDMPASVLVYNPYRRYEAWRFVSYMFVHSGISHVGFNILVQLFLGVPLEMVHGWWRVLLVYFSGVIAGSLGTSITDPDTFLAGASGGVYALMFAHLASIIINWSEMEFAWLRLLFFGLLTGADLGTAIYYRYVANVDTRVGYVAHAAGAIIGLLVGIKVLRNLEKHKWEKVLWYISLVIFIVLMLGAVAWNIFYPDHFPPSKYGKY